MDFVEENDDIILLLLVASGVTNVIIPPNIISELKLQDRYDYRKYFCMNRETRFLFCFFWFLAFSLI